MQSDTDPQPKTQGEAHAEAQPEAEISYRRSVLLCVDTDKLNLQPHLDTEFANIRENFCGRVFNSPLEFDAALANPEYMPNTIYVCGDISAYHSYKFAFINRLPAVNYVAVEELSMNNHGMQTVPIGRIPIVIEDIGVYVRDAFITNKFHDIANAHQFQSLTESNKEGEAYRKGIYISELNQTDTGGTRFNLLRCSTNFTGPTEGFSQHDESTIETASYVAHNCFENPAQLNHVLAQIYYNAITNGKERKGKIKEHSDKTKDMPRNGLIAFCTFYDSDLKRNDPEDKFNVKYKDATMLTSIRFRRKSDNKKTLITLYPNSIFMISLKANRLYTHEIVPPCLPNDKVPIRMGYVIRCSNQFAIHKDGKTYPRIMDTYYMDKPLMEADEEKIKELKDLYCIENKTEDIIEYPETFISMNRGDYQAPMYCRNA